MKKGATSIYPGDALIAYIDALGPRKKSEGVSKIIDRMADRYAYVLRESLPQWTIDEWLAAVGGLKGHSMDTASTVAIIGLVMQAAVEKRRDPGTRDVSGNFAYQAKRLPASSLVALAEICEKYWRLHTELTRQALTALLTTAQAPGFSSSETTALPA